MNLFSTTFVSHLNNDKEPDDLLCWIQEDSLEISKYNKSNLFHYTSFQIQHQQRYELLPETMIFRP